MNMFGKSPYIACPTYETESFILRLVDRKDAENLLFCYSDREAVAKINADYCTSDFYCTTIEQMDECIDFWLTEYRDEKYVRFSIVSKEMGTAVGTVEIFGGDFGVLRIDIASKYEQEKYIAELLYIAVLDFIHDFRIGNLKIKASKTPERIPIFEKYGFVADEEFRPGLGYYKRYDKKCFDASKGVAFCGLACCVCGENETCVGCRQEGCRDKDWCKSFNCCKKTNKKGCWDCENFPCGDNSILQKMRVQTFAKFIKQYGEEKLIKAMRLNEADGVLYHYPNQLVGDYDLLQNEDEMIRLLMRNL